MELEELYALMERFARSGLTDLEWEREGEKIALRRSAAPVVVSAPSAAPAVQAAPAQAEAAAPVPAAGQDQGETVNAPLVGTFYAAPAPGEEAFGVGIADEDMTQVKTVADIVNYLSGKKQ